MMMSFFSEFVHFINDHIGACVIIVAVSLLICYPITVLRKYARAAIRLLDGAAPTSETGNGIINHYPGEEVSFQSADGFGLRGLIISGAVDRPTLGMIVFAHEFASERSSAFRYTSSLLDAGYDVFTFDFRGHGQSQGEPDYRPRQWPSRRERSDMLAAIDFIGDYLERKGRGRDVGLFGISRGGGAAILAAAERENVRAIVTDGAFSSDTALEFLFKRFALTFARLRFIVKYHPPLIWQLHRWFVFREFSRTFQCRFPSVRKGVKRLSRRSILFIHGEKDSYIPIQQSQVLYEKARGPKEIWIVPHAKHNQSVTIAPEAYGQRITQFFKKHLYCPAPALAQPSTPAEESVVPQLVSSTA